jgi:hypothetical protein
MCEIEILNMEIKEKYDQQSFFHLDQISSEVYYIRFSNTLEL